MSNPNSAGPPGVGCPLTEDPSPPIYTGTPAAPMDSLDRTGEAAPLRSIKIEPQTYIQQPTYPPAAFSHQGMVMPNYMPYPMFPFYMPQSFPDRFSAAANYAQVSLLKLFSGGHHPSSNEVVNVDENPPPSFDLKPNASGVLPGRVRKEKRGISPSKKDDRYYDRRRKNNRAAKKSREKQRISNIRCRSSLIYYHSEVSELTKTLRHLILRYAVPRSELGAITRFLEQPVTAETAYESSQNLPFFPTFPLSMSNVHLLIDENGAPIKRYLANEYQKFFNAVPPDLLSPDIGVTLNDFNLYDRIHPNLDALQNTDRQDSPDDLHTRAESPDL